MDYIDISEPLFQLPGVVSDAALLLPPFFLAICEPASNGVFNNSCLIFTCVTM
jgi:hypothetical protein